MAGSDEAAVADAVVGATSAPARPSAVRLTSGANASGADDTISAPAAAAALTIQRPSASRLSTNADAAAAAAAAAAASAQREDSARVELKSFLGKIEGSSLRAWIRHFDANNDGRITKMEFSNSMRAMSYPGDIGRLFATLDGNRSGELTLDEIDEAQASLWRRFRSWCVSAFEGVGDLLRRLGQSPLAPPPAGEEKSRRGKVEEIDRARFRDGLVREGWTGGCEDLLFTALDVDNDQSLSDRNLRWLDAERRRLKRKEQAKYKASQEAKKRVCAHKVRGTQLTDFKLFLNKKYGGFIRAWRVGLSHEDSLVVTRPQFMKACGNMGFGGDLKLVWQVLDKDDSGFVSLDELDPHSAEQLARFKVFVETTWGSTSTAFRALDKDGTRKISVREFADGLQRHGFEHSTKLLFHGLDSDGSKFLEEENLEFIDKWKPLPFLLSAPNPEAREQVKALLQDRYHNFLKAWRHALDRDSSNRCNWGEFQAACRKLHFTGDIAGAWRALDEDLSGFITLREIDAEASDTLFNFQHWADQEFGGVRSAFGVFDNDGSKELSYKEFRRSCRIYGYDGSTKELFQALDTSGEGTLSMNEVAFLDDWELRPEVVCGRASSPTPPKRQSLLPVASAPVPRGSRHSFQRAGSMQRVPPTEGPPAHETEVVAAVGALAPVATAATAPAAAPATAGPAIGPWPAATTGEDQPPPPFAPMRLLRQQKWRAPRPLGPFTVPRGQSLPPLADSAADTGREEPRLLATGESFTSTAAALASTSARGPKAWRRAAATAPGGCQRQGGGVAGAAAPRNRVGAEMFPRRLPPQPRAPTQGNAGGAPAPGAPAPARRALQPSASVEGFGLGMSTCASSSTLGRRPNTGLMPSLDELLCNERVGPVLLIQDAVKDQKRQARSIPCAGLAGGLAGGLVPSPSSCTSDGGARLCSLSARGPRRLPRALSHLGVPPGQGSPPQPLTAR